MADSYSEILIGNDAIGFVGARDMGIDTNITPLSAVLMEIWWILGLISIIYHFHESTTFHGIAVGTLNIFQYDSK